MTVGSRTVLSAVVLLACAATALAGARDSEYDAAGRRDPFLDPRLATADLPACARLDCQRVGQVRIQGVAHVGDQSWVLLIGTEGNSYAAREGDTLADGRLLAIDFDRGIVEFQERVEAGTEGPRWRRVERRFQE